jgi:hypothetical protein
MSIEEDRFLFNLDLHEVNSPLWIKLREQLEWELKRLRELNDDGNLDQIDTAILRGRIKQLKIFLTFGNDREAENT